MVKFNRFFLIALVISTISCASFRTKSVPVTEQIAAKLNDVSLAADAATSIRVMTSAQRQSFALNIMLPAIAANKSFAQCLSDGTCSSLPAQLRTLAVTLLKGITDYTSSMPQVPATNTLATKLQDALTFINGLLK